MKNEILKFSAKWCQPCKILQKTFDEQILPFYGNQFNLIQIDCDEKPELAAKYGVRNLPTLIFFKEGIEVKRVIGSQTKEKLIDLINTL